ncbi:hypothetical protein [Streptosporangium canum]|uniref:hypothetical protein n=1 Tax=Streptosporangium canum TaxID=324952 RepID=UPI0037BD8DAC
MDGFERLMPGRPEISDGTVTVINICVEAGVSRASYYRSPVAAVVKELLAAPAVARPEVEELRAEIARLKKAERKLRSDKAEEIRDLADTMDTYANHIQVLTCAMPSWKKGTGSFASGWNAPPTTSPR